MTRHSARDEGAGVVDEFAGDVGAANAAAKLLTVPGAVARLGESGFGVVGPFGVRVEEHEIGGGALGKRAGGEFKQARRFAGPEVHQGGELEFVFAHEDIERDGEGGLEAEDAVGGEVELAILFVGGVWGVVGGEDVEGAVFDAGDDGKPVRLGAEGRVHLEVGVVGGDALLGEGDVVGRGLTSDAQSARFGAAKNLDRVTRGDVLHVDVRSGVFGEDAVARYDKILGGVGPALEAKLQREGPLVHDGADGHGVILTVVHERQVEHLGVFAGAAHEFVGLHAIAVVGDGDDAGAFEGADGSECMALHADGDATGGVNVDAG